MPSWIAELLVLAVGLAMDAMAVAAARGLVARDQAAREGAAIAVAFGIFQGGMPALGWALGLFAGRWIEAWDHWVAFVLLGGLGAKMLHEAWSHTDDDEPQPPLDWRLLLTLSVATSVDALVAGITLPALGAPIAAALVTIGVTTAVLCAIGFALGRRLGQMIGRKLDAAGGLMLIGVGTHVLAEHMGWLA